MAARRVRGPRRRPGELEERVLEILWSSVAPMTAAQVHEALPDVAHNTVLTSLTRLQTKGILGRERADGKAHAYFAVVSAPERLAQAMRVTLTASEDRPLVLKAFVDGLDPSDEELLRELMRD